MSDDTAASWPENDEPPTPALVPCHGCGALVIPRVWQGDAHRWHMLPQPVTAVFGMPHECAGMVSP